MYCQWQYTRLQILTMTRPPGSHNPLHRSHLTANKVPHTRNYVDICHSQGECSPLHRVQGPTHAGVHGRLYGNKHNNKVCFKSLFMTSAV